MARRKYTSRRGAPKIDARRRAWQSMRILGRFTAAQIQLTADISKWNAGRFISLLLRFGYVQLVKSRLRGSAGSCNVYVLARNTGPKCPVFKKGGDLIDPNLGGAVVPKALKLSPAERWRRFAILARLDFAGRACTSFNAR